jgi:hypothetical protein
LAPAYLFSGDGKEENMDGFLFIVIFAFLLFAVILPIAGFVIGFFCYYVLPYAFAAVLAIFIAVLAGVNVVFSWWVWVVGLIWAASTTATEPGLAEGPVLLLHNPDERRPF